MTRWITSYWDEEDTTFVWEVGGDGRVSRHIELIGPDQRPQAASSLDEWRRERDAGRIQSYRERYGALADQPITDWDFPHSDIPEAEFERLWTTVRRTMESKPSSHSQNDHALNGNSVRVRTQRLERALRASFQVPFRCPSAHTRRSRKSMTAR